jgi:tRNA modification GTPase
VDSAGLRPALDPVEAEGVARTLKVAQDADLILLVVDGSTALAGPPALDAPRARILVCLNKADLGIAPRCRTAFEVLGRPLIVCSAKSGEGIGRLRAEIVAASVFAGPWTRDLPCPFTPRQRDLLAEALSALPGRPGKAAAALQRLLEDR